MDLDFPHLTRSQVALLHAETRTGIVLDLEGKRWFDGCGRATFMVFESLEKATAYAEAKVEADVEVECAIFNANRDELAVLRIPWPQDDSAVS